MARLRVALCQLDTVVGDVDGNAARIVDALDKAEADGADVAVMPELAVTGYPPEDLLLKPAFVSDNLQAIERVASHTAQCAAVVGFVDVVPAANVAHVPEGAPEVDDRARRAIIEGAPRLLRNAVAVCASGKVLGVYHKRHLPNYGVFDEQRWFAPGVAPPVLYEVAGVLCGVSICEDLWFGDGPVAEEAAAGAAVVLNVNASPFFAGRWSDRVAVAQTRVSETGCAVVYINQVGGQDELVFDGGSFVLDPSGELVAGAPQFVETVMSVDVAVVDRPTARPAGDAVVVSSATRAHGPSIASVHPPLRGDAEVYEALVLGTRDYLQKNGFEEAVIGLSGGIDSSLVATIAVDALGQSHVHGVTMPSRYSSEGSWRDAEELAARLGIELTRVPIETAHRALADMLTPVLGGAPTGLTDENLQSRIRGILLMAISNARGWIVLTTGNKSELATGYSTLYGDSAGGFAVIKDVPKTLVYRLSRYRNARGGRELIPASVLDKPPSAELRPDQRDDQSLPPYDVLDPVLEALVEHDRSVAEIVADGYPAEVVIRVARLVDGAEYKRRQSPPGVRITPKAFGKDRRMPITNRYRDGVPARPPQRAEGAVPAARELGHGKPAHGR